jgi:hypothetical protein
MKEALYRQERQLNEQFDAALLKVRGSEDELKRLTDSPDLSLKNRDARDITERRLSKEKQELEAIRGEILKLVPLVQAARSREEYDRIMGQIAELDKANAADFDAEELAKKESLARTQRMERRNNERRNLQILHKDLLAKFAPHSQVVEPQTKWNKGRVA